MDDLLHNLNGWIETFYCSVHILVFYNETDIHSLKKLLGQPIIFDKGNGGVRVEAAVMAHRLLHKAAEHSLINSLIKTEGTL